MSTLNYSGARTGRQVGQQGSLRVGEKTSMQRGDDINREMGDDRRASAFQRRLARQLSQRSRRGDIDAGFAGMNLMRDAQERGMPAPGGIRSFEGEREMAATRLRDRHRLIQQQDAATDGTEETEGTEERDVGQSESGAFRQPERDTSGAAQPSIRPGAGGEIPSLRPSAQGERAPAASREPPSLSPAPASGGELSALDRELLDHGNEVIANRGSRAMPLRGRLSSRLEARAEDANRREEAPVRSRLDDQFPEAFGGFSTPEARIAADNYRREGFPSLAGEPFDPAAPPSRGTPVEAPRAVAAELPPSPRFVGTARGGDATQYGGIERPDPQAMPEPGFRDRLPAADADAPTKFDSFRSDRGRAFQEGVVGAAGRFAEGVSETAGMIGRGILGHRERVLAGIKDRQMASYERGIQEIEARKRREVPASRLDRLTPWGVPTKR